MILCDPLPDVAGYRLPKAEQKILSGLIKTWIDRKGWAVNDDYNYLDEPLIDLRRGKASA